MPGRGKRKGPFVVSKTNTYLYEFSLFDVMPNELIINILKSVRVWYVLSVYEIPGKLSVLDDGFGTNEMIGYSSAKVAMR